MKAEELVDGEGLPEELGSLVMNGLTTKVDKEVT